MATGTKRNPGDATGAERDRLQKQHAAELADRQNEMAMAAKAEADEAATTITDMTGAGAETREPTEEELEEIASQEPVFDDDFPVEEIGDSAVTVDNPARVVRVNSDIDQMTVGEPDKSYSFQAGRRYKVPHHVAVRLEELDLIWH